LQYTLVHKNTHALVDTTEDVFVDDIMCLHLIKEMKRANTHVRPYFQITLTHYIFHVSYNAYAIIHVKDDRLAAPENPRTAF
jgi:hypothetical protein